MDTAASSPLGQETELWAGWVKNRNSGKTNCVEFKFSCVALSEHIVPILIPRKCQNKSIHLPGFGEDNRSLSCAWNAAWYSLNGWVRE